MINTTSQFNSIMQGNFVQAAYSLFDVALNGWTIALLFFVLQAMILYKTKSGTAMIVVGMIGAISVISMTVVPIISKQIMFALLVFELAAILVMWLFK